MIIQIHVFHRVEIYYVLYACSKYSEGCKTRLIRPHNFFIRYYYTNALPRKVANVQLRFIEIFPIYIYLTSR